MSKKNKPEKQKKEKLPRKEGRKIKTLSTMSVIIPYIMPTRNDALNYIADSIDITAAEKYIAAKRAAGYENFGMMHIFLAAYVRTVAEKPGINRFIRGQRVFARNNIEIMLTIKKEMVANSPDTVVKIFPKPTDTAIDIYKQMNDVVIDSKKPADTDFDTLMRVLHHIPGLLLRWTVKILNFFDYFGLLPRFLTKLSPFHGSFFITSMGSLGIPPIYHHIYNFGNVPIFLSFGAKRSENYIKADGTVGKRKMVDYKIVTDERICDGFYYAIALKNIRFYLKNPEKLDIPPAQVIPDIK